MKKISKILKSELFFVLAALVIFLASMLRVYKFDIYPLVYNSDGQTYNWVGSHLLSDPFSPQGTSLFIKDNPALFWFSHYNYYDTVRRYDFRLSDPFLDAPPFAMPIFGVLPKLFAFEDFSNIPQSLIRLPAILISVLTLFLTYSLAKRLFAEKIALLSVMIYGFTPYFVFAHREAFLENILTPLYLIGLLLLDSYLKKNKRTTFIWLIIVCLAAGLTKTIGLTLAAIVVLSLFINGRKKQSILLAVLSILAPLSYFLYGFLINSEQMFFILKSQSGRGFYLGSIIRMISQPDFYEPFLDGWYVFAFMSYFIYLIAKREQRQFSIFIFGSMMIILSVLLSSGFYNSFFWYRYPLFPFISITAGWYLFEMFKQNNIKMFFPFMLFALLNIELLGSDILPANSASLFRYIYLSIFLLMLVASYNKNKIFKKIARMMMVLIIAISLAINMVVVFEYPQKECLKTQCRIPEKVVVDY